MIPRTVAKVSLLCACVLGGGLAAERPAPKAKSFTEILASSQPSDWRPLDPDNTLYLELASGRVVIELAPTFAPRHAANLKTLVREKYFDGLAFVRSQDNYVVQWADPVEVGGRSLGTAAASLPPEFTTPWTPNLPFTRLADRDGYAPQVGFSQGFPVGRDPKRKEVWLTHCYGAVGVARDSDPTSGSGSSLYVVTGHAPRHLDRNFCVIGRVVLGMEKLSVLPRGTGALGFYEKPEQRTPILALRLASGVAPGERTELEVLRTDTKTWTALVEARRNRRDDWYKVPAGYIELGNLPIPVRPTPK